MSVADRPSGGHERPFAIFRSHDEQFLRILMSFTSGADAERLGLLSDQDRRRTALAETTKVWPEAPQYWEGAAVKYWNEDRWVRGSYSFRGVGQKDFRAIARKPEGRVFFAGEHTETSSMNGAIASGVRTADLIQKGSQHFLIPPLPSQGPPPSPVSASLTIAGDFPQNLRRGSLAGRATTMAERSRRQENILELIGRKPVRTQQELLKELRRRGVELTQATLSRELKSLGVAKGPDGRGGYRYVPAAPASGLSGQGPLPAVAAFVSSVERSNNLLVVKTPPGNALSVARGIDQANWSEVMGTIAGNDTILIICRNQPQATRVVRRLKLIARL